MLAIISKCLRKCGWLLYRKYVTATAEVQTSSKISLNLEQRSLICYDVLTELFFYYYKKKGGGGFLHNYYLTCKLFIRYLINSITY